MKESHVTPCPGQQSWQASGWEHSAFVAAIQQDTLLFGTTELEGSLLGAIQFSFATNTEMLEAKLSASSGSCTVLQAEN